MSVHIRGSAAQPHAGAVGAHPIKSAAAQRETLDALGRTGVGEEDFLAYVAVVLLAPILSIAALVAGSKGSVNRRSSVA